MEETFEDFEHRMLTTDCLQQWNNHSMTKGYAVYQAYPHLNIIENSYRGGGIFQAFQVRNSLESYIWGTKLANALAKKFDADCVLAYYVEEGSECYTLSWKDEEKYSSCLKAAYELQTNFKCSDEAFKADPNKELISIFQECFSEYLPKKP